MQGMTLALMADSSALARPLPQAGPDVVRRLVMRWIAPLKSETRRSYLTSLAEFATFLGARLGREVGPEEAAGHLIGAGPGQANALAAAWQAELRGRFAAGSVNVRTAALRSLVKVANEDADVSWVLRVRSLKVRVLKDTRGPGLDGYVAMLDTAEQRGGAKGARDAALLATLYELGLRRGEVVSLDLEHLDLARGTVSVLGKARDERETLTLPPATRATLARWLEVRGSEAGPLFYNLDTSRKARTRRLSGAGVWAVVKAIGRAAAVELPAGDVLRGPLERVRPHGLRHAAITDKLEAGSPIQDVQKFSRHMDLRLLSVYDDRRKDIAGDLATQGVERARAALAARRSRLAT
jgi:integrase/recombinase XerC